MKFSCNNCNTKYSLPDEKFAGKTIALTCKKCGSKIVVKPDKPSPSEKVSRQVSPSVDSTKKEPIKSEEKKKKSVQDLSSNKRLAEKPKKVNEQVIKDVEKKVKTEEKKQKEGISAPEKIKERSKIEKTADEDKDSEKIEVSKDNVSTEEEAIWYYSRGGQQKGPFTEGEIKELVDNNVITPRTFVWKDGMMDWMKASTCKEFAKFFGAEQEKAEKDNNAISSLGLDELDKKYKSEKQREEKENIEKANTTGENTLEPHAQDDFFNKPVEDTHSGPSTEEVDWSKIPATEDTDAPKENTRVFIMRAGLSESAKRKRMLIRAITAVVLIGVFLFIFIKNLNPILSAVGIQMKSGIDLEMEDLDKDTLSSLTPEEREKYRKALLGIKESKNLSREQKKRLAIAIKQKKESDVSDLLSGAKVEGGTIIYDNLGKDRLQGASTGGANLNLENKLAGMGINTKIEGVDLSSKVDRQDINLSSKIPERVDELSEDLIMAIVNRNMKSVKYCYERHLKASSSLQGKAIFKLTIQSSGQVSKVESLSNNIAGSLFEECIIKELKKWVFPKFSGNPIVFEVPFILTTIN